MMYIGLKCLLGHTVHIDTYVDRTQGGSVILEWLKKGQQLSRHIWFKNGFTKV